MRITFTGKQKAEGRRQKTVAGRRSPITRRQKTEGNCLLTAYCLLPTIVCLLLTAYCLPAFSAQELPPLNEAVEKLQNKYRETSTFSADFHQLNQYKALTQKVEARGRVWIKKPGKIRWDYFTAEKNQIISDGKTLWMYSPLDKQVIKSKIDEAFGATPQDFLLGLGELNRRFHASYANSAVNAQGFLVLNLTPKEKEPTISRITLEVAPQDFTVERFSLVDLYGNLTILNFSHIKFNQEMNDSLFQFRVPPGVEVVVPSGSSPK